MAKKMKTKAKVRLPEGTKLLKKKRRMGAEGEEKEKPVIRFRLLPNAGKHRDINNETFRKNEVIETTDELDVMFAGKFQRLDEPTRLNQDFDQTFDKPETMDLPEHVRQRVEAEAADEEPLPDAEQHHTFSEGSGGRAPKPTKATKRRLVDEEETDVDTEEEYEEYEPEDDDTADEEESEAEAGEEEVAAAEEEEETSRRTKKSKKSSKRKG